jgi:hypothetical protein
MLFIFNTSSLFFERFDPFPFQGCGDAIHKKCLKISEGEWGICKASDLTK